MGDIFLKSKEARRLLIVERLASGQLTVFAAASQLGLSARQLVRLKGRYLSEGASGLVHKGRGRPSPRSTDAGLRDRVLALASGKYAGANYSHLADLLSTEEDIQLSSKTIARILRAAQVPPINPKPPAKRYRRRHRKPRAGMLVQTDSSPFDWLGLGGPLQSLHGSIDDATGDIVGLYLLPHECLEGYLRVVGQMVRRFGVPAQMYTDRHSIFVSPKKDEMELYDNEEEHAARLTQFGRALFELGMGHVLARSPQAKGRIERLWGTLQQRLPVELKARGIQTIEGANAFLYDFCVSYNKRFRVDPVDEQPAWRPRPERLDDILCTRHERRSCAGSVISFEGKKYQLIRDGRVAALTAGAKVILRVHLDGRIAAEASGQQHTLQPFQSAPKALPNARQVKDIDPTRYAHKPAPAHPWRQYPRQPTDAVGQTQR